MWQLAMHYTVDYARLHLISCQILYELALVRNKHGSSQVVCSYLIPCQLQGFI